VIPHPERILYPDIGLSRAELVLYYHHVAAALLDHIHDRTLTIRRWPHGIGSEGFYQRYRYHAGQDPAPIVVSTVEDLLSWVGIGAIEFHSPLGRRRDRGRHDWAVIDLDPNPPAAWPEVLRVAQVTMDVLDRLRLPVSLKTSGAAGLHLFMAIEPTDPHEVEDAIERIVRVVNLTLPEDSTLVRRVADRGPRVYLDFLQNGPKRTMAAVYSARAVPDARVSWPVGPHQIQDGAGHFTVRTAMEGPVPPFVRGRPVKLRQALDRGGLPSLPELRRVTPAPTRGAEVSETTESPNHPAIEPSSGGGFSR
jgi:bifunctional non-homologous end joining protein LigD